MVLSKLIILLSPYVLQHCTLFPTYMGYYELLQFDTNPQNVPQNCLDFTNLSFSGVEVPNEHMIDDEDWVTKRKNDSFLLLD